MPQKKKITKKKDLMKCFSYHRVDSVEENSRKPWCSGDGGHIREMLFHENKGRGEGIGQFDGEWDGWYEQ